MAENTMSTCSSLGQIYEHPFNERIRLLLRLETIFVQALRHQKATDQYETQFCLDALFALLDLTNRYELRAELLRELERVKTVLLASQVVEGVNVDKVTNALSELSDCVTDLHGLDSKHIDSLRNIEFLNNVRHRKHDTGNFLFELPALQYWLAQSQNERQGRIQLWLNDFIPLKNAVDFLLHLIRESAEKEHLLAENGVYIKKIDERSSSHQLLRIEVSNALAIYPRVSGDKFRFAIRFMIQNQIDERAKQAVNDVKFTLHTCGI